jgi:hypothetical protein
MTPERGIDWMSSAAKELVRTSLQKMGGRKKCTRASRQSGWFGKKKEEKK